MSNKPATTKMVQVFDVYEAVLPVTLSHSTEWWDNPDRLIALVSALVALASAAYAASSARIAKKAYRLAVKQDALRNPRLIPHLSAAHILKSGSKIEVAISMAVANPSDIDNSIAKAELVVEYGKDSSRTATIRIPPNSHASVLPLESDKLIGIPKAIPSHQTVAGWLIFNIPNWIVEGREIENYSLAIYDSHEEIATLPKLMVIESHSNPLEDGGHAHAQE